MKIHLRLVLLLGILLQVNSASAAPTNRVEALLQKMTLEEKIGQMTLFTSDLEATGPTLRDTYRRDIREGRVGAIFNAYTPEFTRTLQKIAVEETRLHIPLLFGYDVIHGHRTIFPIPLGEACSWDLGLIERNSHIAASEAAADGLHWTFAPMVDIARDPRWGRISEGAGEDVYLGCAVAQARVRGFQGSDLAALDSVLACAKHYAAYGAAQAWGRDYNTVDASRQELLNTWLPPYQAAVGAGVATVMTAFNELDGIPCTANTWLLRDVLRNAWGFSGMVVTDYTSINEMVAHGFVANVADVGQAAALAGVDMDMQGAAFLDTLARQVREGHVPLERVNNAVRNILRLKVAKGLFDDPYRYSNEARCKATLMKPEYLLAARDAARRSVVLLENRGVLPLGQRPDNGGLGTPATIALVGPLAKDRKNQLGSWTAAGDGEKAISVYDAMMARTPSLSYSLGCDIDGTDRSGFQAAVDAANKADVVVAVMGESAEMSGEAASRSSLDLPGVQRDLLAALKATGKPVVLVLMNGRPLTLGWEKEHMDAIVETWFGGTEAGPAIADVLFGDYNPAGRLVTTFPRSVGQIPLYYSAKNTGRPMLDPHFKYASRYLDVPNDPLYPFGYGLSYTTFTYSPLTLSRSSIRAHDTVDVAVTVNNTGTRDGEEVVQLYLRQLVGSVTRPVRELKGFRKVLIPRGGSKTVTFTLGARDLAFWRRDMTFGAEAGKFRVWVGPNSASGSEAAFRLTESVAVKSR